METPYNYARLLGMVVHRGRQLYGPAFHITEEDSPVLRRLLCWFLQDQAVAAGEGICLRKGILLAGPIGCGKSALMRVFQSLCDKAVQFAIRPCTTIELEFAQKVTMSYSAMPIAPFTAMAAPARYALMTWDLKAT